MSYELENAYRLGYVRGRADAGAAATWVSDSNESDESRNRKLGMLRDGDPEVWDLLPREPNLSGEWADDPTPLSLAREETGEEDPSPNVIDACAEGYIDAVNKHFESACEQELMRWGAKDWTTTHREPIVGVDPTRLDK